MQIYEEEYRKKADRKWNLPLHADEEVKEMTQLDEDNDEKAASLLSKKPSKEHLLGACLPDTTLSFRFR